MSDLVTLVHLPRTGGTTATQYLLKLGLLKSRGTQRPIWAATEEERGRKVYGLVRHPVTWYRSVWAFMKSPKPPFAEWLMHFIDDPTAYKTCVWGKLPRPPCPEGFGAYSYYHLLYYCDEPESALESQSTRYYAHRQVDVWLHTETLESDLMANFGAVSVVSRNVLSHGPLSNYYDDHLLRLVYERDSFVIGRHYLRRGD
jgi:hypothetical protein